MHSMAALERMGFEVTYIKPTTEGYILSLIHILKAMTLGRYMALAAPWMMWAP